MIISKTPYRLSLFGGGTDYPAWFQTRKTKIISASMAHYCYISIKNLPPFFYNNKYRISYSKIEWVKNVDEIEHPSIRACLNYLKVQDGLSIAHDGDLPARSGIGSSSSFTVGLINALRNHYNLPKLNQHQLAMEAINIEQNYIGESVGVQDQIMAAYGGIRVIELSGANINVRDLRVNDSYVLDLEEHIMLGFSGIDRFSDVHAKQQVQSIKEGKSVKLLEEISVITNNALHILENYGKIKEIV